MVVIILVLLELDTIIGELLDCIVLETTPVVIEMDTDLKLEMGLGIITGGTELLVAIDDADDVVIKVVSLSITDCEVDELKIVEVVVG